MLNNVFALLPTHIEKSPLRHRTCTSQSLPHTCHPLRSRTRARLPASHSSPPLREVRNSLPLPSLTMPATCPCNYHTAPGLSARVLMLFNGIGVLKPSLTQTAREPHLELEASRSRSAMLLLLNARSSKTLRRGVNSRSSTRAHALRPSLAVGKAAQAASCSLRAAAG